MELAGNTENILVVKCPRVGVLLIIRSEVRDKKFLAVTFESMSKYFEYAFCIKFFGKKIQYDIFCSTTMNCL